MIKGRNVQQPGEDDFLGNDSIDNQEFEQFENRDEKDQMAKSATGLAGFKKSAVLPPHPNGLAAKDQQFSKSVASAFKIDRTGLDDYCEQKIGKPQDKDSIAS